MNQNWGLRKFKKVVIPFIILMAFTYCEKPERVLKVTVLPPEDGLITYSSAVLKGEIIDVGSQTVEEFGITISGSSSFSYSTPNPVNSTVLKGIFEVQFTNLERNKDYYYRAYTVVNGSVIYSRETQHFKTKDSQMATVVAGNPTEITTNSVHISGEVTYDGGEVVTSRGFCWDTTVNPIITRCLDTTINGSGSGVFYERIRGLTEGTTYFIRAYATNIRGTSYNNSDVIITTLAFPSVTTTMTSATTPTEASGGGNVTSDGGAPLTGRGVCWNTTGNPTVWDNKTTDGIGLGSFTSLLTDLQPGTLYYVKAYATTLVGTSYGQQVLFNTKISDIDGNVYKTVTIGTQVWMAENLKTIRFNNGDLLGTTTPATLDISGEIEPKYQWPYLGDKYNIPTYGLLYTWYAAIDSRSLCPTGWHIPSYSEVYIMLNFLGGDTVAGNKLREVGIAHWPAPNTGSNNASGFTALPGGYRSSIGIEYGFEGLLSEALFWTSTLSAVDYAWSFSVRYYYFNTVYVGYSRLSNGYSIRCIKNY